MTDFALRSQKKLECHVQCLAESISPWYNFMTNQIGLLNLALEIQK